MIESTKLKDPFLADIDLKSGVIYIDSFEIKQNATTLEEKTFWFGEDLLHIVFDNKCAVDLGWYSFGFFRIEIIGSAGWEHPLYTKSCISFETMKKHLQEAIDLANEIQKTSNRFNSPYLADIDLKLAPSLYDSFDINPMIPFEEQAFSFRQNLIQITYPQKHSVDVGWYPEHDITGSYTIEIIHNFDWKNQIYVRYTNDFYEMKNYLREAIDLVDRITRDNSDELDSNDTRIRPFKSNYLADIDIKSSSVILDGFEIDPQKPFEEQKKLYESDLLYLVNFKNKKRIAVDVGWKPEGDKNGNFQVLVVFDSDWDKPIYKKNCKDFEMMKKYLQEAIDIADEIPRNKCTVLIPHNINYPFQR